MDRRMLAEFGLDLGLGTVFLFAGLAKAVAPGSFIVVVEEMGLGRAAAVVALGAVSLEIAIGVGLIMGANRRACLWCAVVLLAAFSIYALLKLAGIQSASAGCHCFGELGTSADWVQSGWFVTARNLALLSLAGVGLRLSCAAEQSGWRGRGGGEKEKD